jgi:glycine cleavage system H protein
MCGLYALYDPSDRRLDFRADQAVGAVAAWGELEVHRTGFRAEHACIVALAVPERADPDARDALERASARYRVPLVPAARLSAEARRHGAPLDAALELPAWPTPPAVAARRRRGVPPVDPSVFGAAARGIALDAHLWVETALGSVVLGITRALARELGPAPKLSLPDPGVALAAGDRAATITTTAGSVAVWAPVGGSVLSLNPRLTADPDLLARDPEGAGWLLRLAPRDWEDEAHEIAWGRTAAQQYAASVARDAVHGDAFADVRLERVHALPPVRSAGDVLALLRAERAAPRFDDAAAVHVELGGRIRDALAADPPLRAHLGRLGLLVRFVLHEPDAELVLDLRSDARVVSPVAAAAADLELACAAEDAYRLFTGTLDPAGAVRCRALRSSAGAAAALRALAVLKHLRVPAWTPGPVWAR